jgi:CheY-like chemotaxis protein
VEGQVQAAKHVAWVVDDDELFRFVATEYLKKAGYNATGFSHSMKALAAFEAGARPDVLIVDLMLQEGEPHGLALASMLRLKQPALSVIYVTAGAGLQVSRLAAFSTVLLKPLRLEELGGAVRAVLNPAESLAAV